MATEPGTQAIDRAAELLVRVVESGQPLAVGELAAHTGLPKSTTSRLVGALERRGLVQRSSDRGRLSPGPVLLRFAHRDGGQSLVELAGPMLERLAAETRETTNLAVPGPLGAEHLDQRDSEHFVGVTNWVGRRVPHHVAANGKIFMAFGAAPIPAQLDRFTPRTITSRAKLERELERVRALGYGTAVDELELGLAAMAAPVRGDDGAVVAALSISGPTSRLTLDRIERLAPLLLDQAATLGRRLDHRDHERGAA
ncbi:MAG: IclR family transcriptional regulator [Actinobacteria bacterium]|nr:MAG: IclR family transcriptional regulator [Actinomycetota bacterium]